MTYNVFSGTLNPTHLLTYLLPFRSQKILHIPAPREFFWSILDFITPARNCVGAVINYEVCD